MRGKFVLVLGVAVAAAVAISQWDRNPTDDDGTGPDAGVLDAGKNGTGADGEFVSSNPVDRGPNADSRPIPLVQRIDAKLKKGELSGAADSLLAAEAQLLERVDVRGCAFRTADALIAAAKKQSGKAATKARLAARKLYAAIYNADKATPKDRSKAFEACRELNRIVLFSNGASSELVLLHKLKSGDRVWSLANGDWKKRGVTASPGFILFANGISDPRRVPARGTLRVPKQRVSLLIRKSQFQLTVLLGGVPVERFKVGLGADESTPTGTFTVKTRLKNPDWYFRGRKIPFGDPENVIGTRWMGLDGSLAAEGIGIHGTDDAASVGKAVSMGCVRMRDPDVERLFEWVGLRTEVEIRE